MASEDGLNVSFAHLPGHACTDLGRNKTGTKAITLAQLLNMMHGPVKI